LQQREDFADLRELNSALERAYQAGSAMGCLEGFVDVIRRALHLGIMLRHEKTGAATPAELKALT